MKNALKFATRTLGVPVRHKSRIRNFEADRISLSQKVIDDYLSILAGFSVTENSLKEFCETFDELETNRERLVALSEMIGN